MLLFLNWVAMRMAAFVYGVHQRRKSGSHKMLRRAGCHPAVPKHCEGFSKIL